MQPRYSLEIGRICLNDSNIADLIGIDSTDERKKYLEDLFDEHPYEAYDFLSGRIEKFCDCADLDEACDALNFDVVDTVLKAVIAAGGAYAEELVCFLLEAHADYNVDVQYLLMLPELPLAQMPVAESYLWMLHDEKVCYGLLPRLCKHYGLHDYVIDRIEWLIENLREEDQHDPLAKDVIIQCFDNGIDEQPSVALHSYRNCQELFLSGDHYSAIESLDDFKARFPGVLEIDVVRMIAKCYLAAGWNYFAVTLIDKCMRKYPDEASLQAIHLDSFSINKTQVEVIKKRLNAGRWSENCADIMAVTELMYRYYGKLMTDYGSLANGFGRAVETELRERVYEPVIKKLLAHSTLMEDGRQVMRVYKVTRKHKEIVQCLSISEVKGLGTWVLLFNQDNYQEQFDIDNTFFNLFTKCFGSYVRHTNFGKNVKELGLDIRKLNNIRCRGSHNVLKDWDKVKYARELTFKILEKYAVLLRLSGSLSL